MSDRSWKWLLSIACWIILVAGLRAGAALLIPIVLATFLSMVTYPVVAWLKKRGVPDWVGVLLVLLVSSAVLVGPGLVLRATARDFAEAAPLYQDRLQVTMGSLLAWFEYFGLSREQWAEFLDPQSLLNVGSWILSGTAVLLSNAFVVLLLMSFMLLEAALFSAKLQRAGGATAAWLGQSVHVTREVHVYVWVHTVFSVATGLLLGLWTGVLGVEGAVLWGFLAFVLNYVPYFGSIVAGLPPVLLAFLQFGIGWALAVAAGYLAVNIVLGNVLEPIVMGREVGLSPLVVMLSILVWGWIWGPVGMLLGVPIMMVLRIALEQSGEYTWLAVLLQSSSGPPVRTSGE